MIAVFVLLTVDAVGTRSKQSHSVIHNFIKGIHTVTDDLMLPPVLAVTSLLGLFHQFITCEQSQEQQYNSTQMRNRQTLNK